MEEREKRLQIKVTIACDPLIIHRASRLDYALGRIEELDSLDSQDPNAQQYTLRTQPEGQTDTLEVIVNRDPLRSVLRRVVFSLIFDLVDSGQKEVVDSILEDYRNRQFSSSTQ